ncbi:hypothetical protein FS749_016553 [Ceratobasidium sp. UAMH 11750]|nr:hypothetical protein FS749_016553 [Ceratobasidium sp. UAMH 11750]
MLSIEEGTKEGKVYAYYSWAYEHALVPPPGSNYTQSNRTDGLVRPDYVVKTDDDSFVVLSELEARLRVEWYGAMGKKGWKPLVYWGYLAGEHTMTGELNALSWPLVSYVARDERVRRMVVQFGDQQVVKWTNVHSEVPRIRWRREQCWIYGHPRSANGYAHGFLYPSEVERVRKMITGGKTGDELRSEPPTPYPVDNPVYSWSSVTGPSPRFRLLAGSKSRNLTAAMRVEALVEGSALSWAVSPGQSYDWSKIQEAYDRRETHGERYLGKKVGGTVAVNCLKKDEWFLETAVALLGP